MEAMAPFGIDAGDPLCTLPGCFQLSPHAVQALQQVLHSLVGLTPEAVLELYDSDAHGALAGPSPWSLRWCLLAGSLCDVLLAHSTHPARFWPALEAVVLEPRCAERLDIWGDERVLERGVLVCDASRERWAAWLTCALLSGLLPAEQLACPQLVLHAQLRHWGAAPSAGLGGWPLAAAASVTDSHDCCTPQAGVRLAVTALAAITAASAASLSVRPPCATPCASGARTRHAPHGLLRGVALLAPLPQTLHAHSTLSPCRRVPLRLCRRSHCTALPLCRRSRCIAPVHTPPMHVPAR
jgi:hypothetical protein